MLRAKSTASLKMTEALWSGLSKIKDDTTLNAILRCAFCAPILRFVANVSFVGQIVESLNAKSLNDIAVGVICDCLLCFLDLRLLFML